METFDANKRLPQNVVLRSAETHSYKIGLSFDNLNYGIRDILHNPLLIVIIITISIIKVIIQWLLPDDNPRNFIFLGDFTYFLGIRPHQYIATIFYALLSLTSQVIYYYNHKNDIKPSFLKVFQMISGLVSPKSIGLTDKVEIYKLVKISKILFKYCRPNVNIFIPFLAFILNFVPLVMNSSFADTLIYSFPHSIIFSMLCHYIYTYKRMASDLFLYNLSLY